MLRRWMLVLLGCTALAIGVMSCDDDNSTAPGTQPLISQITATPAIVNAGGQVAVGVTASGGSLTYLWSANGGSFADHSASSTTWTAPTTPGVYQVTVTVANANNLTAVASKAIGVQVSLLVSAAAATVTVAHETRIVALAVGEGLTYHWDASAGTLRQIAPDTVMWRAPDSVPPQFPRVTVVVTDGSGNARTGSVELQVTPYTPTDLPTYKGDAYCNDCHADKHVQWAASEHASAFSAIADIGMGANPVCVACHTVGSVGVGANPALNNGGYDDLPIAALRNVQCENCHGPGGAHPDTQPTLAATIDAANCGTCHNGPEHATYDEYQLSGHGNSHLLGDPTTSTGCVKCHNGVYATDYLDNPAGFANPTGTVTEVADITCAVCHDPHGSPAVAQLRLAATLDFALPNGRVVAAAGAGRLCIACHNSRRSTSSIATQISDGNAHFGPHHAAQGDMLAGTGAYEAINPTFPWGSSTHLQIQDGCISCHTHPVPGQPEEGGEPNYTGHTFAPRVEACAQCHGPITDFDQVLATADFDGNGQVQGVQIEVEGLITILHDAIVNASDTPEHRQALLDNFEGNIGLATITTVNQRKAAYNLLFVEFDQSTGVHNAKYAIQLLQQSILFIEPVPTAARRWTLLEN